jgi:hypothetical protein
MKMTHGRASWSTRSDDDETPTITAPIGGGEVAPVPVYSNPNA